MGASFAVIHELSYNMTCNRDIAWLMVMLY